MGKEITSIDIFHKLIDIYEIRTTPHVAGECMNSRNVHMTQLMKEIFISNENETLFNDVFNMIRRRYSNMGAGETASIAESVILTLKGIENYVVTDDALARKVVLKLCNDLELEEIVGTKISINCTGTIGIIKHLMDKGIVKLEEGKSIAHDLENSGFRVTDQLLDLIRCTDLTSS